MFLAQLEQIHVQFIQQASLLIAAHHTFDPEKAGQPVAPGDWLDLVHAGAGVEHHIASAQLDALFAKGVLHHQFTALVFVGVGQEHGAGDVGAYPQACVGCETDGVVHMVAIGVGLAAIAVDAGRKHPFGQCCGEEDGVPVQPAQHHRTDLFRRIAVVWQLFVVFDLAGLHAGAGTAVCPRRSLEQFPGVAYFVLGDEFRDIQQHGRKAIGAGERASSMSEPHKKRPPEGGLGGLKKCGKSNDRQVQNLNLADTWNRRPAPGT